MMPSGRRVDGAEEDPLQVFSRRIADAVGEDGPFVSWTIRTLMDRGNIKVESPNGSTRFFWTHNLQSDRHPAV